MPNSSENKITVIEPEMEIENFGTQKINILQLVKKQMKLDQDYGVIPGTKNKTLYQPGAEKLAKFFGLGPKFELIEKVEDFNTGFFYYRYRCTLVHLGTGIEVGNVERSCNSFEKKYRYETVAKRYATEEQKKNSIKEIIKEQNGYKNVYLQLVKSPDELCDQINTITAMAQKRALVAAVRTATMASDIFKDEIEENGNTGPATKAADPQRTNLIAKLHVVAGARGFNEENLHKVVETMYGVPSITDLENKQIYSLTEKMLSTFKEVPAGEKPERIEKAEVVETTSDEKPEIEVNITQTEEKEPPKCKNDKCTKGKDGGVAVMTESSYNEYFCTEECRDIYWEKADKIKSSKTKMDEFIAGERKLGENL